MAETPAKFDLIVAGATPAGVICAVRAAREGLTVLLTQHNQHVGGMLTNGLVEYDALSTHRRCPLFRELTHRIETHYRQAYGEGTAQDCAATITSNRYPVALVEPRVVEQVLEAMLKGEPRITVWRDVYPEKVDREGALVTTAIFRQMEGPQQRPASATTFVDCTYEGDLAKLAGAAFRVGREGRNDFDEPHAGVLFTNIESASAPQMAVQGRLAIQPYTSRQGPSDPHSPQNGDKAIQAYNYRPVLCNDPANRISIDAPPANYDRTRYLTFSRKYFPQADHLLINGKGTCNAPILPGENWEYPDADWAGRAAISRHHLEFALGFIYFMQNDATVNAGSRESNRKWGLPADEYGDNGHVPYEMYVRETRRLIGRHVLNERDLLPGEKNDRPRAFADSIAFTDWYMDSHSCSRDFGTWGEGQGIVGSKKFPFDGKLVPTEEFRPGMIPYRALLPVGIDNLLVPVCLSATHVAWGSVRLEPMWIHLGEVAGYAAAAATSARQTVADLSVSTLQNKLLADGASIAFFNQFEALDKRPDRAQLQLAACHGEYHGFDLP